MDDFKLFGAFAHRYDLHTPPEHSRLDYELVLGELRRFPSGARILDLGCGTGAFLQCARDAGFDASGIDMSRAMVALAEQRVGPGRVRVQRLQDLEEQEAYDALVSLSMPFNYCADVAEARKTLVGFYRALRPGGLLLLQVIHAAHAPARLLEEWTAGPGGEQDVQFLCRFTPEESVEPAVRVQYVYSCRSLNELLCEEHLLHLADAHLVADLLRKAGFSDVRLQSHSPTHSVFPFVQGFRPSCQERREL